MQMPSINEREVLHYMGCDHMDDRTMTIVHKMMQVVMDASVPRVIWREFALENGQPKQACILPGNDIVSLLKESTSCIMFGATLGMEIDRLIKRYMLSDMGEAVILDACANAGIEAVCDAFCDQLEKEYAVKGRYLTDRFSCGYGDLPIHVQQDFVRILDTRKKIGLYVNESHTLMPCKSVTAIMGVADTIQPYIVRGCSVCRLRDRCAYRKGGTTCGK